MIGHLLTAAGAAGMLKILLALQHQTLPPSLHFEHPAPGQPPWKGAPSPYRPKPANGNPATPGHPAGQP